MFDIGWPELFVIAVVALVVIGPKDLPRVLHTVGKWVRKARSLARDFQSSVDDMVREAELDDLRKQMQQARSLNVRDQVEKAIDPKGQLRDSLTFGDLDIDEGDDGVDRPSPETKSAGATPSSPTALEHKPAVEMPPVKAAAPDQAHPAAPSAPETGPADAPAAEKRG
ncbi:Sec-independent protein translocase protein TatB [Indioceanicola profundi]|uniref:Sec-independent protein translocase protein TatB n=1 Tax=Indioceanicola profundi TaxID=2220096 RepID=UPI000E6AC2EA|nr:Sec-independent protein translocase protein TatB [Indioceanicola profundi]